MILATSNTSSSFSKTVQQSGSYPVVDSFYGLREITNSLDPIGLADMKGYQLFNRIDRKYFTTLDVVAECLIKAKDDYFVVDAGENRLLNYSTLYFDTHELGMYGDHHKGKNNRFKIRYREYAQTGDRFLEIKYKTGAETHKKRVAVDRFSLPFNGGTQAFIEANTPYKIENLQPTLKTDFVRITLVNKRACERITIDVGISFDEYGNAYSIPNAAIIEIKKQKCESDSSFSKYLKCQQVRPTPVSKYCVGMAGLHRNVKHNRFKPILRMIEKHLKSNHQLKKA